MFRYDAASETFSRLLQLVTDSECCIISVPSVVNIYINSIAAHFEAALYDKAVILCDTVLDKVSSLLLSSNAVAATTLLQSQHNDKTHQHMESTNVTRKRIRSVLTTDGDGVMKLTVDRGDIHHPQRHCL